MSMERTLDIVRWLASPRPSDPAPDFTRLSPRDWRDVDHLVAANRIGPLLHHLHSGRGDIPATTRTLWADLHRVAALDWLRLSSDLRTTVRHLRGAGIEPVALKGAWLAAQAYPAPALRPMRDFDLLVPAAQFRRAIEALSTAGYAEAWPSELTLEQIERSDKSPPPLIAPLGAAAELHLRAWFPPGSLDYPSPLNDDEGMIERASLASDGIAYPSPEDMFRHLVIHAVYGHRLDCGPLLFADIGYLLEAAPLDWDWTWRRAAAEGWRDGARLVLDLVMPQFAGLAVDLTDDPGPPTAPEVLAVARRLLFQDLSVRKTANFAAQVLALRPKALLRRLGARQPDGEARVLTESGGWTGWAARRLLRSAWQLTGRRAIAQTRDIARFNQFLER